jgi:hypothetical protein
VAPRIVCVTTRGQSCVTSGAMEAIPLPELRITRRVDPSEMPAAGASTGLIMRCVACPSEQAGDIISRAVRWMVRKLAKQ